MKRFICSAIVCVSAFCVWISDASAQSLSTMVEVGIPNPASVDGNAAKDETGESTFSLSAAVNALSMYEWRGYMTGGFSLSPELTLDYAFSGADIYFDAWFIHCFEDGFGSFPKEKNALDAYNELDLTLGFGWKGLGLSLASYLTPLYGSEDETSFALDATLSYSFGFGLGLSWSTLLSEPDRIAIKQKDGTIFEKVPYSSYAEVSFCRSLGPVDFGARVGAVPWQSPYIDCIDAEDAEQVGISKMPHFTKLALEAGHSFALGDGGFAIPIGVNALYNPTTLQWGVQFTAGISFDASF